LLLEHAARGDLHTHLRCLGSLSEACARFLGAEVVVALRYVHASGFAFGDLKPENILLTASGAAPRRAAWRRARVRGSCGVAPLLLRARARDGARCWSHRASRALLPRLRPPFASASRSRPREPRRDAVTLL
jgi:serine/threonine protein kinase